MILFGVYCLKINFYPVITFLKYGPSEVFTYSVSDQYKFHLPLHQQVFNRGLDTTSLQSEKYHQNTSDGKEDFQSIMETRREWKQKVCESSNKSDRRFFRSLLEKPKALLSHLTPLEKMVYYV